MPIDLATVFQAVPYVQNVAHAALVNPEAQLVASQALAQQAIEQQNKQTQRIEQQDGLDTVRDEDKKQGANQHQSRRRQRAAKPEPEETQASNSTPFAGHIINVKI
ncbi:hypothetical protein [Solidesulfovibrio sp.]